METKFRIFFKYKLQGYFLVLGSSPVTGFFCCPQESACLFSFSLLLSVFSKQFFSPSLIFAEKIVLLYLLPYMCISEVSMLMFLLLNKEREMFQKQRDLSSSCATGSFFPPSEHFQGEKVVYKCHLYFRGKSDCSYSGLWQRQQLGVTNRTLASGWEG